MMKALLAGIGLTAALALSACGGAAAGAPASPAPSASTATVAPSPTPTEISHEDAAAQYLSLVAPYNEANQHLKDVANAPWDQVAFSAAANGLADANQTFLAGLLAAEWPADIRPTVEKLAADSAGGTTFARQLAAAQSEVDVLAAISNKPDSEASATAQLLRLKLGLDEIPVPTSSPSASA